MPLKNNIASTARGFALAGFSLFLFSTGMTVLGADASGLKKTSLRGLDGRRIEPGRARSRSHGGHLLFDGMSDLEQL